MGKTVKTVKKIISLLKTKNVVTIPQIVDENKILNGKTAVMIATKGLFTTAVLLYMLLNPIWKTRQSNTVFFVFTFMVVNVAFAQAQIAYPSFVFISLIYYALTMESSDSFENAQEWI